MNESFLLRICNIIVRPFLTDIIGFFLFLFLFSSTQVVEFSFGSLYYGIYMAIFAFLQFYAIFFVFTFSSRIYRIIKPIIAVFLFLYFIFHLFCLIHFGLSVLPNFLAIILSTNYYETRDFLLVYVKWQDVLYLLLSFFVSLYLYKLSERVRIQFLPIQKVSISLVILLFSVAIVRNNKVMEVYWDRMVSFDYQQSFDLSVYYSNPSLDCALDQPEKVIIIIGESFTPTHSSLYGYPICTNPQLEELQKDNMLYVYDCVSSPATYTIQSFMYILNTHLVSNPDSEPWYKSLTMVELLKTMGYNTCWISNQAEYGLYDYMSTNFARICDDSYFIGSRHETGYDEELLNVIVPSNERQAVFYHLMGQHGAFDNRYPKNYDVFNEAQYIEYPSHQIEPRRTYDNATLYNDYVCSSLFRKFQDQDAIGFYFPDHGQDFYDVDDDFYGHGRIGIAASVEAARRIPFMVYVSPLFRQRHPDIVEEIIKKQKEPMCTDAFIFLFMHLLNVKLTSAC